MFSDVFPFSVWAFGYELCSIRMKYIKVILNKLSRPLLSDIFYKVNVPRPAVSPWAMQCVSKEHSDWNVKHFAQVRINLQSVCLFNLLACSSNKNKNKKSSPEPISQYTLSASSPYQHTKPWCSYVMSEKQKQGGGLLSCVRGWGLRGVPGHTFSPSLIL